MFLVHGIVTHETESRMHQKSKYLLTLEFQFFLIFNMFIDRIH